MCRCRGIGVYTEPSCIQQLADLFIGIALRGNSPADQLAQFTRPEGMIYALLLLAFALMPLGLNRKSA